MSPLFGRRTDANLAGINFEHMEHQPYRPGFWGRLLAIVLTLIGILIVVWLLFNPIRTRPSVAQYIQSFNRIAAAQGIPDRLEPSTPDLAAGSRTFELSQAGLMLKLIWDDKGYVTKLALTDDLASQPADGWLKLTPNGLRNRFLLMLDALDPKWTVVSLYRSFSDMGIDLDQPLAAQPAGTREQSTAGLNLSLTHDGLHVAFETALDVLAE